MSKKRITPMQWIIRILIVLLFCVALFVGFARLMEWNELQAQKEALEKEKAELEEQGK